MNVTAFDVALSEVTAVMDAWPAVATSAAGTAAVRTPALPNVVASGDPFQATAVDDVKFAPLTVSVNAGEPASFEEGLIDETVGPGARISVTPTGTETPGPLTVITSR